MTQKPPPEATTMNTLEGGEILFKLDDWEIHAMIETKEIAEALHWCDRPDENGEEIEWSYQLPNDDHCPGCDAIQPDEIQGLVAMYNMDHLARVWDSNLMNAVLEQMKEDYDRIFAEQWKSMSIEDQFK